MLPRELSILIFDAGGTLVTLDYAWIAERAASRGHAIDVEALPHAEAAARHEVDRLASQLGAAAGSRQQRYFGNLLRAAGVPDSAVATLVEELKAEHRVHNLWRVAMPGAPETLRGLRERNLRVAVISNADGRAEQGLTGAGLVEHLELVVDSHHEGVEKPDPAIFHLALERLGVAAQRAAYIGDIYSIDAVGARAAGIAPVIIDATGDYGELDCPVIGDLRELLRWLDDDAR